MNSKKICFIVCTNSDTIFSECIEFLKRLYVPDGYETEIRAIHGAKSMTSGYNEGMKSSDAKYKVYMHQDVFIINSYFIYDILQILSDDSIGLMGIVGYENISSDCIMWHEKKCGCPNMYGAPGQYENADYLSYRYSTDDGVTEVRVCDGLLLATSKDIEWDEEFDAWDFYDASQCVRFTEAGYKIVVPNQRIPWVVHDDGLYLSVEKYNKYRHLFAEKYCPDNSFERKKHVLSKDPLVTVIMPAYNHEKYIAEAIESVLSQTFQNFKFIVADDCSSDSTRDVILRYEDEIDEIHFFDVNSGIGRYSEFIGEVSTKYIALINSDDYWEKDKLEKQIHFLEKQEEYAACFSDARLVNEEGKELHLGMFLHGNMSSRERFLRMFSHGNHICHPSKVIRTEVEQRLFERYDFHPFRQLPDFYMWLIILQQHNIYVYPEKLINFRIRSDKGNASAGTHENDLRGFRELTALWRMVIEEMPNDTFKAIFESKMINTNPLSETEFQCEKYFVMARAESAAIRQAAIDYYYKIARNIDVYECFTNVYGFGGPDFHKYVVSNGTSFFISDSLKAKE